MLHYDPSQNTDVRVEREYQYQLCDHALAWAMYRRDLRQRRQAYRMDDIRRQLENQDWQRELDFATWWESLPTISNGFRREKILAMPEWYWHNLVVPGSANLPWTKDERETALRYEENRQWNERNVAENDYRREVNLRIALAESVGAWLTAMGRPPQKPL